MKFRESEIKNRIHRGEESDYYYQWYARVENSLNFQKSELFHDERYFQKSELFRSLSF